MDIKREYASLAIHVEERRPAATGKAAHGSFNNPSLGKQFFNDQGNRASLQAGNAGQISA